MKKIISLLVLSIFVISSITFATTTQYIELSSGEQDDGAIYLNSYEDYIKALGEVDEQKVYKEDYLDEIAEIITTYDESKRDDVTKALVTKVNPTEEYYSQDANGTYKIKYQPIEVLVLEGEHKDETFELSYILTADSYENINVKPVRENQKINVLIYEYEGEYYAYGTTVDASVYRIGYTISLAIVTILFMAIYLGKKGLKILPILALIMDLILLVFVPEVYEGRSILWLSIVTSIAYVIVNASVKVGVNSKMIAVILSTIVIVIAVTFGLQIFNNVANMSGITLETAMMVESFPKGSINFYMLNIAIFIIIMVSIASDIACKTVNEYDKNKEEIAKENIKEYMADKIVVITVIQLALLIPKYLYLLITKYVPGEIINSEILTTEIVRILMVTIGITLTSQITAIVKKLF